MKMRTAFKKNEDIAHYDVMYSKQSKKNKIGKIGGLQAGAGTHSIQGQAVGKLFKAREIEITQDLDVQDQFQTEVSLNEDANASNMAVSCGSSPMKKVGS